MLPIHCYFFSILKRLFTDFTPLICLIFALWRLTSRAYIEPNTLSFPLGNGRRRSLSAAPGNQPQMPIF